MPPCGGDCRPEVTFSTEPLSHGLCAPYTKEVAPLSNLYMSAKIFIFVRPRACSWCMRLEFLDMAMLTHDVKRPFHPTEKQLQVRSGTAIAHLVCLCVLTVLLTGGALAAVIA